MIKLKPGNPTSASKIKKRSLRKKISKKRIKFELFFEPANFQEVKKALSEKLVAKVIKIFRSWMASRALNVLIYLLSTSRD
jgi:hypothetical protein